MYDVALKKRMLCLHFLAFLDAEIWKWHKLLKTFLAEDNEPFILHYKHHPQVFLTRERKETRHRRSWYWHICPGIFRSGHQKGHYNDVIMSSMASQITSLMTVYSTVYSRHRSMKTSKPRVTGLFARNSPVTGDFLAQRVSNAENVFIWWRLHDQVGFQGFAETEEIHSR